MCPSSRPSDRDLDHVMTSPQAKLSENAALHVSQTVPSILVLRVARGRRGPCRPRNELRQTVPALARLVRRIAQGRRRVPEWDTSAPTLSAGAPRRSAAMTHIEDWYILQG